MKSLKRILVSLLILFIVVFCNGCYYVFYGQFKSAEKIKREKELSLYEKTSAYTMNIAIWSFGWLVSPEAAEQAFLLHFVKEGSVVIRNNPFFLKSKILQEETQDKYEKTNYTKTIKYPKESFSISSSELRYALAIDGAEYSLRWADDGENIFPIEECKIEASYKNYIGSFKILGSNVYINYSILRYLQQIGWLSTFTIVYSN